VFADPMPGKREIASFYDGFEYRKPPHGRYAQLVRRINTDVRKIVGDLKTDFDIELGAPLLDYGGGTGFYANAFSRYFNVTMMDIDEWACRYARNQFSRRFEVVCGDAGSPYLKNRYKLVYCNHVVEHCPDPKLLLRQLAELLDQGGILVMATPNRRCKEFWFRPLWFRDYLKMASDRIPAPRAFLKFLQTPWLCCDPPRHLYAFTSESLRNLAEDSYDVLRIFTEYSPFQYYHGRIRLSFALNSWRSLIRIAMQVIGLIGITWLRYLDIKNNWGNNLVAVLRRR